MKPPIIKNPKGASRFQRYSQRLLTGAFWVGFAMLLRPLLTLFAWYTGAHLFNRAMFERDGWLSILKVPFIYPLVVVAIGGVLIGWAIYNQLRFQNNERRTRHPEPLTSVQLAHFFQVDEEQVRHWQNRRRIVMIHDDRGNPREVESE
ncbi:poly-beta-1,6-N-acetyl-D-glucosamine biosynthesis protein PgaD [Trichloromonas acetexigens]|uniref:Poly-beta-1,6-N-acetyl-D-glucosamine biosynthesis protein PgaD n=1 Tax=Trichloromonas acetexigens TaxID=38815 RepID=A0A550JD95_9BACT|nr:poly-beta-1,6-N-acetyl-D-glucosamine biosynthesis protein PgaD [Desulfuromonas acetexigens]TRO81173.1 poly-beta-1,6-N-acetyl-D-glucosamine biosynthesis protein PgaD [Desulfuromonas acetexigens]